MEQEQDFFGGTRLYRRVGMEVVGLRHMICLDL